MRGKLNPLFFLAAVVMLAATAVQAVTIDLVTVGNPGNAADNTGYGAVDYAYQIGKHEVTAGQYTAFLNAVAKTDTYGLYNASMAITHYSLGYGSGINRSGSSGGYNYSVDDAFVNRPVNYVSWGDAARFVNWLDNGQPIGDQGDGTTETGAYTLDGATSAAQLAAVRRNPGWTWALPSEDEWYKAAYHKGGNVSAGYWLFPTQSDLAPGRDMADVSGNNANYYGTPVPLANPYWGTTVGQFQNSESAYGTFDQGGNVWEWNEAVIGTSRGLRGGSFYAGAESPADMCSTTRWHGDPSADNNYVPLGLFGFRVVQVPEPGSLALLAGVAVTMLLRRRSQNA
ncbi:MAG TPA: PEP-CTERM sorting domain-containing protein [Planctomycetaceae bacterium]|nr:PEP-CTERM sorting domain-containing protein [Planctomycetaceae bacterium]